VVIEIVRAGVPLSGQHVAIPTRQGRQFGVYLDQQHHDLSGSNSNVWNLVTLVAEQPIVRGPLDLGPILDYLLKTVEQPDG
jgi:hypothetical protein